MSILEHTNKYHVPTFITIDNINYCYWLTLTDASESHYVHIYWGENYETMTLRTLKK